MENKIILHRGYKGLYPENSKISFKKAFEEGKSFETDIRISKDGICFMIHDWSIDRLFNGSGNINEITSGELNKFRYKEDNSQRLCSLKEMCELIKDNPGKSLIFVHIKEIKDINEVMNILKQYDFDERIRFFACDDITKNLIEIIKREYPRYKVGLHFYENNGFSDSDFKKADFIWADEITKKNITGEIVRLAHNLGKPIYAISPELISESIFNSNIKKRWQELLEIGVDGICTDLPEKFEEFLDSTNSI